MGNLRYSEFAREIDIDEFEIALGFEVENHARDFDNGQCPDPWGLHKNGDTTGKFGIHRENRTFNCYVCGGGTLLSLVMAVKDYDEEEAIDYLYQFTKPIDKTDEGFIDEVEGILAVAKSEREVQPWFNENVMEKWMAASAFAADLGRVWLEERGITDVIAHRYKLGFDPEHTRKSKSKGTYTGPGIILPHYWQSRLVGWQVRWLDDDRPKWVPKYTNTHDFPREETLFNYEAVYFSDNPIVVAESVPTVLFLASLGIPAISTFGSNVSSGQIRLLRKCQQGLVLAPDNDSAGRKWIQDDRSDHVPLAEALARYVPVQVTLFVGADGEGGDLGNLVKSPEAVHDVIAFAEYYYSDSI